MIASIPALLVTLAAVAPSKGPPQIMASTAIAAAVVRPLCGTGIVTTSLLPDQVDLHLFQPAPRDLVRLRHQDLFFLQGAGLEQSIRPHLDRALPATALVDLSAGLPLRCGAGHDHGHDDAPDGHAHGDLDPHVWLDPILVQGWISNAVAALTRRWPESGAEFRRRGEEQAADLRELHDWIEGQVRSLPPSRRLLVTDHHEFAYFAARYGFELVGSVLPALTTEAQPSARDLARLRDTLRARGIRTIFVGSPTGQALSQRLAAESGARVVPLAITAVGTKSGAPGDYPAYMRRLVTQIVEGLRE